MAVNVEIKAILRDRDQVEARARVLCDAPPQEILQRDVFFDTLHGRLKLRVLAPDRGWLVYYEREDAAGPRPSTYQLFQVDDPPRLEAMLAAACGVRGEVRKQRTLYMVGQTRVHLDKVAGLGDYVELEAVLQPGQTMEEGQTLVVGLMARLGIETQDLVDVAYMDLIERLPTDDERRSAEK